MGNYLILNSSVFWCSCVMCGLPFFSVAGIKDVLLIGGCFIIFYLAFIIYAYRTFYYSLLLGYARSYNSLFFLEGRQIFRYGLDLRRFLVFFVFLLPVLFSFLVFGSLDSSVDFYYLFKSFRARLYVFSGFFSYGLVLKDWS